MQEIWKSVPGYDNLYKVSSLGRIANHRGKILKSRCNNGGYQHVCLYKKKDSKRYYVHRLVADAFILKPQGKVEVNHKDGCKTNNSVENLEWCTHLENMKHFSQRYATYREAYPKRPQYRLGKRVECVETCETFDSISAAARAVGVAYPCLYGCLAGYPKRKTAGGYHWKYANNLTSIDQQQLYYSTYDKIKIVRKENMEHTTINLDKIEKLLTFIRQNYDKLGNEADQKAFKDILSYLETAKPMVENNKYATCLYDAATKYANQLAFRLFVEDKLDSDITKIFREFESVKTVSSYANAYTEEEKARADEITKAQQDYMAEREPFEVFRAVIAGMSKEEAEKKQAAYKQRQADALHNAGV